MIELFKAMEHCPSSETDSRSACEEISLYFMQQELATYPYHEPNEFNQGPQILSLNPS
jgi:hypothetical protein